MPEIPDLTDPRYLDEVGWFLHHEACERDGFTGSYREERLAYSRMFLQEVLSFCGEDTSWLCDKTVVTLGCGCTGDLTAWPAAVKIAVDPLLYTYQQLGMIADDLPGTAATFCLSVGVENLCLLDDCADLVLCRNALDHMFDTRVALQEISRILKSNGAFFLSVDVGGEPTPDEPTVFSEESLLARVNECFHIESPVDKSVSHSRNRPLRMQFLARNRKTTSPTRLDKEAILNAYRARCEKTT
jgi:SAM-dependent methyltransferase